MPRAIATNTTVDREGLLEFLRPRHHAILMTTRRDGRHGGHLLGGRRGRRDENNSLQHRIVANGNRVDRERAQPRPSEYPFNDDDTTE